MRHRCPRPGCRSEVDNRLFSCREDWFALSRAARGGIYATASMGLLSGPRREAIQAALDEWKAIDAPSGAQST
jgi:hypothetical protein